MNHKRCLHVALLVGSSALSAKANTYLDPSAGSIALQVVAGGLLAVVVTLGQYWRRLRSFFRRRAGNASDDQG